MGYIVDEQGHCSNPEKREALLNAPALTNIHEVKSYLGMLQYYGRFLLQLSSVFELLHHLLRKGSSWHWGRSQQRTFEETKQRLCSAGVLAHFNDQLPVHIFCDASSYGVGAVLAHELESGEE